MRHFLAPALAIPLLTLGVAALPLAAGLVPPPRGKQARLAGRPSAGRAAVAVTSVAVPAQEEDLTARQPRAGHEPQGFQAPLSEARGSGPTALGMRSPSRWIASALLDSAEGSEL